jgi:hypothetical protein
MSHLLWIFIFRQVLVLDSSCVNIKSMKCLYVWQLKIGGSFQRERGLH